MTCDPEAAHYGHIEACVAADREWTHTGTWYQVVYCSCSGWRLIPREEGRS